MAIRDEGGLIDRYVVPRKRSHKLFHDFLYEILTSRGDSANSYDLSIILGRHFFDTAIDLPQGKKHGSIAYASVEARFIANRTTYNFAMRPRIFDHNYQFVEAYVYGLTMEQTHYQLNPVNHAVADCSGKLNWRFSYEEMAKRLLSGILLDGDVCLGMAAAAA